MSLAMGSFGERLRREREMRSITLDEIAESTKISRRHLESLEKEDFDSLPGGIFNRGFIRAYARYLGIDEEQAVADYAAVGTDQPVAEERFPLAVNREPDPELNPRRSPLPLILALLLLVAVLAIFWARNKSRPVESQDNAATPAATGPGHATASAAQPMPSAAPPLSGATANPAPATPIPAPVKGTVAASGTDENSDTQSAGTRPEGLERAFSVAITAKEDSWVLLTADGKTVISRTLVAGEQQSFRAGKKIVFTTGNAGGVDVSFNGKALGAIGNESEKRTLTFNASGLVQ